MSRKRKPRTKVLTNRLSDVSMTLAGINGGTGGSYLSSYNTQAFSNNYSLITLNRIILTYMYTGNGIFQTAIQLPVQDAIGKGIEIESGELDNEDIDQVYDYWEEIGLWQTILNYMTWVRLFGGGALLINTNQKPEKPLSLKNLDKTPLEFYDLDRWQLDTNIAIFDDWDSYLSNVSDGDGLIHLYGEPIHESRFLRGQGKRAPHYIRRQLRGWGMSEGERMIRDLNLYLKTQDSTFELIDEAKIDIYKINGLANKLLTSGGTSAITNRIQAANEIKNYVNALVLDAQEEYEQKQINFTGLAELMDQNRMGVAAALRMPLTKLFGLSASGFNSGDSDLENYNQMVESEVRSQLKPVVRTLLKVTMSHLFGYVPQFSFKFPSLRELTPEAEQTVKTQESSRLLAIYDRGLMDGEELMQSMRKAGVVQIETKTEQGLNPNPEPPEGVEGAEAKGITPPPVGRKSNRLNAEFKEEEHPRDKSGKFGKGGGGSKEVEAPDEINGIEINKEAYAKEKNKNKIKAYGKPTFDYAKEWVKKNFQFDDETVIGIRFDRKEYNEGSSLPYSKTNLDEEGGKEFPDYDSEEYEQMEELEGTSVYELFDEYGNVNKYVKNKIGEFGQWSMDFEHATIVTGTRSDQEPEDDDEALLEDAEVLHKMW